MKNIFKLYISAGLLALGTGCTDLNVDIYSQYESFPDSDIALEAKMSDVYFSFRTRLGREYMEACALSSDEHTALSFSGNWWDKGRFYNFTVHNFNSDNVTLDFYEDLASGVTKCNRIIQEFGSENIQQIAPAMAMRAFYNFILMDNFGATPILDNIPDEGEAVERAPRSKVASFIESDLLNSINYLSRDVNSSTYGKPTRWMAAALLVKLYINWGVYSCDDVTKYSESTVNPKLEDCIKWCDEIIKSGIFMLTDGYREKFLPTNGPHIKDFIYAMPYDCYNNVGMQYARPHIWKKGDTDGQGGPSYFGYKLNRDAGGNMVITPDFVDLFSLEGDDRNDVILKDKVYMYNPITFEKTDEPYLYNGSEVILTKEINTVDLSTIDVGDDFNGWCQGYRSIKWWPSEEAYNTKNRNQENDVPIFRYADILLTKAEAILRGGTATNGDTPKSLMNQIRQYVHAPLVTSEVTLQELLDERGREFFEENWRRNDLIRFNKFESDWGFKNELNPKAKTDKNLRILPIPLKVMNKNTNWEQNPGY